MKIIGITVCYETPGLIAMAVRSMREVYPEMPLMIIDGSKPGSPCFAMVDELQQTLRRIIVRHVFFNIGHGNGLQYGIQYTKSDHILIFDSDIVAHKPCVEQMITRMDDKTLGAGYVVQVDKAGFCRPNGTPYLHPYFALINREVYNQLQPLKNHGAPFIDTMLDAKKKRIKMAQFNLEPYVTHKWKGTRTTNPKWMSQL